MALRASWLASVVALFASVACGHDSAGPPAGKWSAATPLPADRFEAYAATLGGKIHYVGGITGIFGDLRSIAESTRVDVFDPQTNAWTSGPPLPADAPKHHLAVAVNGDKLYVLGGFVGVVGGDPPGMFHPIAASFVFDGATWTRIADQPVARGAATAQAIDGVIYVAGGGDDENAARADLYAYDPLRDTWSKRADMPTPREHVASCAIDGKMIAVGGWSGADKHVTAATEVYDPKTDSWSKLPDLPTPRGGLGGIALGGTCYFVGGERWDRPLPATFTANEGISLATGAWRTFASMPTARHGIGVALLSDGIHVVGGGPIQGNSYTSVVEIFTP